MAKESRFITVALKHPPIYDDIHLIGCVGCEFRTTVEQQTQSETEPGGDWHAFLKHLKKAMKSNAPST